MGGGSSEGNFRDRSPIRRREFDMGNRGREPDMPMRGREPEMMLRGREPDRERGPRDFDGRDREWGNRERNLDHYPVEPYMEHERERHPRDPFHQMPSDNLGGNFGYVNIISILFNQFPPPENSKKLRKERILKKKKILNETLKNLKQKLERIVVCYGTLLAIFFLLVWFK